MADEIDIEPNNLCTSEDAFEQFQASSMYEETESLTLPKLVELQPVTLNTAVNDIPYDNEVVVNNLDGQIQVVNIEPEPCAEPTFTELVNYSKCSVSSNQSEDALEPQAQPNHQKPKRGRKKKNLTENNDDNSRIQNEANLLSVEKGDNVQINISEATNNQSHNSLPVKRKRGRPRKDLNKTTVDENNDLSLKNSIDTRLDESLELRRNTSRSRHSIKASTPMLPSNNELDVSPPQKSKRGRPKKLSCEQNLTEVIKGPNIENNEAQVENIKTEDTPPNKQSIKRGRNKRQLVKDNGVAEEIINESSEIKNDINSDLITMNDILDTPLSELQNQHPGQETESKTISDAILDDQIKFENSISSEVAPIEDDETDDICLSKLKKTLEITKDTVDDDKTPDDVTQPVEIKEEVKEPEPSLNKTCVTENDKPEETNIKRNSKKPIMQDFEYNLDSVIKNENVINESIDEDLLVEDLSKRPVRRKIKQILHYDEESDEDPFANVELSDDEPKRSRKGNKYYSDDEYIPGSKRGKVSSQGDSSDSDSDGDDLDLDEFKTRRKRTRRKLDSGSTNKSPNKRGKKTETETSGKEVKREESKSSPDVTLVSPSNQENADIEDCLQSSVIKANETTTKPMQAWGTSLGSNEFENFLAKKTELKIKKVSTTEPSVSALTPLEIPVINPNEPKKTKEISAQTNTIETKSTGIQTNTQYDIPMKKTVALTNEQSEKACEFLKGIVNTTSELGQLMIQKSEDFIKKKINTQNVTDTMKMDYCVKKSFLLFKLAKHNLIQMEEDLAKQYDQFLQQYDLVSCREEPKKLAAKPKATDSDSDCEIVETITPSKPEKSKPKFNPKTVFLNKELSIKIAKKTPEEPKKKELNIKGRHTVWINDSVLVKKVKPTQSFLAQDSRNKKPPDSYITHKMVSEFFEDYYHQRALSICAPFTSTDWLSVRDTYVCNYFVNKSDNFTPSASFSECAGSLKTDGSETNSSINIIALKKKSCPESLFSLCTQALQYHLRMLVKPTIKDVSDIIPDLKENFQPRTLFKMCLNILNNNEKGIDMQTDCSPLMPISEEKTLPLHILPLKNMCYKLIVKFMSVSNCEDKDDRNTTNLIRTSYESDTISDDLSDNDTISSELSEHLICLPNYCEHRVKTLSLLCLELIRRKLEIDNATELCKINEISFKPLLLKDITLRKINQLLNRQITNRESLRQIPTTSVNKVKTLADICFNFLSTYFGDSSSSAANVEGLTINCVNTMSEEAFYNIEQPSLEEEEYLQDDYHDNDFESDFVQYEDENVVEEDSTWATQLQMKIMQTCSVSTVSKEIDNQISQDNEESNVTTNPEQTVAQIKIEPLEEYPENIIDPTLIKTEPIHCPDEMTVIPENIVTKLENFDDAHLEPPNAPTFDMDSFETFVSRNKMMHALHDNSNISSDEIFSQSTARVRRQFEPDSDMVNENDIGGLLVPHTFEPLNIERAKDDLMDSSSDDGSNSKKITGKKKIDKRKGKQKKIDTKTPINKDIIPPINEKTKGKHEIAALTKKMKQKIRQEEKKVESSDSETESIPLNLRRQKDKKKENSDKQKSSNSIKDDDIQCNNIDSTEQVENCLDKVDSKFTGFSAIDVNEISSYQKLTKFVYDKIITKETSKESDNKQLNDKSKATSSKDLNVDSNENTPCRPVINPDEPVELLECEPALPVYNNQVDINKHVVKSKSIQNDIKKTIPKDVMSYTERNGWKCYSIDSKDTKLYLNTFVPLDKLPEAFVETYFRYQGITRKDKHDAEISRLTNLNSLNRSSNVKDSNETKKSKGKLNKLEKTNQNDECDSRPASPLYSDHCDELTASEDEGRNVDDELPPPVQRHAAENYLAKNSLMNDNESDGETSVKPENSEAPGKKDKKKKKVESKNKQANVEADMQPGLLEPNVVIKEDPDAEVSLKKLSKPGPKSKCKDSDERTTENSDLMLTADKVMNKELTLLHAPVVLDEDVKANNEDTKGPVTRNKQKSSKKDTSIQHRIKMENDSSSEEEKQWVTTKEKLLKRLIKKQDDTSVDDAKRAKLVTEFIERRTNVGATAPETRIRNRGRWRRRSHKHYLERQKQLKVLSMELFGEASADSHPGKRCGAVLFKGRRNIRKVIDKKSLAKSTVIANMEEFERKRRLSAKQNQLRELLGCEEGVNVLVINDEVCLEYDFEQHRPIVSVHPFFTKVMKAHQYEGVKFMWDACFESLSKIEEGHPGGGCILAHCMGLGKTLQVLALLHTVLTHPRAGMQRVLVCCPLSTVLNWVDEIHKWIGPVTDQIKVFELSKLKKTYERAYQLEDWYNGGGIFIIGYELFRSLTTLDPYLDDIRPTIINKIRTALLDPGPDIVVCDEGHLLKNDCSVLAVAMSRFRTKRRIVLTGTPMQNNLREYYCMVNFIKPNLLGTYSEYSNRFENPIMNGQHRDSQEEDIKLMKARTHILHKVLEGCLQRQEASVLYPYLPKKHEYTLFISLTKCQCELYKHYLDFYAKRNKQSLLKDFHVLQKIWSHPQVLHNFQIKSDNDRRPKLKVEKLEDDLAQEDLAASEDIKPGDSEIVEKWWLPFVEDGGMLDALESSNKFVVVFRILEESIALGDKVLIFSTSLFTMDALEYFLKKINNWSLGQEYFRLDGSVPAEVRQKWCREFNAENNVKTKLFLISTRAGSLGLNMTAANRVIIFDTSWNPAHDIQSIFRVYRFGQKKDCFIYRLVALGTMEQKIYERSVTKQAISCRVVDEQQIDRHYNMAELTELYRFDWVGSGVAGGVAVGVCDVALLRVARHPSLHAVHEHDSLLRGSAEQGLPEHERAAAWMQFQQEHAHKQMQAELAPVGEKSVKRPHDQISKAVKVEVKQEKDSPGNSAPGPKSMKGRKSKKSSETPVRPSESPGPSEPGPSGSQSVAIDDSKEEEMIKKITHILIKHNFQQNQGHKEIAQLVSRVRSIVTSGQLDDLDPSDELTSSIASVLMQREEFQPTVSDIKCEPTAKPSSSKKKRRLDKQPSVEEELIVPNETPSKSSDLETSETQSRTARRQRRAAVAAKQQFDKLEEPVIEVDDDEWQADDSIPLVKPKKEYKNKKTDSNKKKSSTNESRTQDAESILLSDDEEPTSSVASNIEPIPLHVSLLSNRNFIQILAHTYLSGNPMLDEDAATLAAQYSALKAQKEVELTGKDITSGPIYDIAVKVLGRDVLKKLQDSNVNLKNAVQTATGVKSAAQQQKETLLESEKKMKDSTQSNVEKGKVREREMPKLGVVTQATAPTVVPVGLIKRGKNAAQNEAAKMAPSQPVDDVCILPDDDVCLLPDTPPAHAPSPAPPAPPPAPATSAPGGSHMTHFRVYSHSAASTLTSIAVTSPAPAPVTVQADKRVHPRPFILRNIFTETARASSAPVASAPTPAPVAIAPAPVPVAIAPAPVSSTPNAAPAPRILRKASAIQVAKGKILLMPMSVPSSGPAPAPVIVQAPTVVQARLPAASAPAPPPRPAPDDAICLDSDEDDIIIPNGRPAGSAPGGPVPVSLTAINSNQVIPISIAGGAGLAPGTLVPLSGAPASTSAPGGGGDIVVPVSLVAAAVPPTAAQDNSKSKPTIIVMQGHKNLDSANSNIKQQIAVPGSGGAKTVLKSGDMIRINKNGAIELCKKNITAFHSTPLSAASIKSSKPPLAASSTSHELPAASQTVPKISNDSSGTVNTPEKKSLDSKRNRSKRTISSSSESSESSCDDPLSILKNVVHIQAPEVPASKKKIILTPENKPAVVTSKDTKQSPTTSSNPKANIKKINSLPAGMKNLMKSKDLNVTPSKPSSSNIELKLKSKPSSIDIKSLGKDKGSTKDTKPIGKDKASTKDSKPTGKDNSLLKKVLETKTKSPPISIDLTNWSASGITINKVNSKNSDKSVKQKQSKLIIVNKNKPNDKVSKLTVGSTVDLTQLSGITTSQIKVTAGKSSNDSKKRVAPVNETKTAKKKKTDQMTLKDFNIDDFDDIIELD